MGGPLEGLILACLTAGEPQFPGLVCVSFFFRLSFCLFALMPQLIALSSIIYRDPKIAY